MIHKRGSQSREPIEDTEYELVLKARADEAFSAILRDVETGGFELWVENDSHSGYTIEIEKKGYEFVSSSMGEIANTIVSSLEGKSGIGGELAEEIVSRILKIPVGTFKNPKAVSCAKRILHFSGKVNDLCNWDYVDSEGKKHSVSGCTPYGVPISRGDYVEMSIDVDTGRIEGWKFEEEKLLAYETAGEEGEA